MLVTNATRTNVTEREKKREREREKARLVSCFTHRGLIYARINLRRAGSATKRAYLKGIPIKLKMIHRSSVAAVSFVAVLNGFV